MTEKSELNDTKVEVLEKQLKMATNTKNEYKVGLGISKITKIV